MKTQEEATTAKSAHFAGQDSVAAREILKQVPGPEVAPVDLGPPNTYFWEVSQKVPSICTFSGSYIKS